jgi:hypothetical protein
MSYTDEEVDAKTAEPPMGLEGARCGQLEVSKPLGTARLKKKPLECQ